MESPRTLPQGKYETSLSTAFSNIFEFNTVNTTTVVMDMELWRTALDLTYGLRENFDVKIEIPFIGNTGGFLDSLVQTYHNAFGLPNGGRELVNHNSFTYRTTQNGTTLNNYSKGFGLSDIVLRFKYDATDTLNTPVKIAIAPYLKLPTGLRSKGFGSGFFDGGVSFLGQKTWKKVSFTTHLGFVITGDQKNLTPIQKHGFFSFGQSIEWRLWKGFSPIIQLTGNTAAFKNTDAKELSQIVLDLNVGFAGSVPVKIAWIDELFYQWSFSEDVMGSGPSVDFSILFRGGIRY